MIDLEVLLESGPSVSIIMVNYNGKRDLLEAIPSLLQQSFTDFEIIMVDNASTDDSLSCVSKLFPSVIIVEAGGNVGFGAGNNIGYKRAKGSLIVITNYDAIYDRDWLHYLVRAATADKNVGMVAPRILLYDKPDLIQTIGLAFQFTGHAFSQGLYRPSSEYEKSIELGCVSGAAFIIKRSVLDIIAPFDEFYHRLDTRFFHSSLEDVDLSWRAMLAGFHIMYEPRALMYHKYIPKPLTTIRFVYLERGRLYTVVKNYKYGTLLLLFPALLFTEILSLVFVALRGWPLFAEKVRSYGWLFGRLSTIHRAHRKTQKIRKVDDAKILQLFQAGTELRHSPLPPTLSRLVQSCINALYTLLYQGALLLVRLTKS